MVRAMVMGHLNRLMSVLITKEVITMLPTYNKVMESPLRDLQRMSIRDLIIWALHRELTLVFLGQEDLAHRVAPLVDDWSIAASASVKCDGLPWVGLIYSLPQCGVSTAGIAVKVLTRIHNTPSFLRSILRMLNSSITRSIPLIDRWSWRTSSLVRRLSWAALSIMEVRFPLTW